MFHKTKVKNYVIQNWSDLMKLPAKKMRLKFGKRQTKKETVKSNWSLQDKRKAFLALPFCYMCQLQTKHDIDWPFTPIPHPLQSVEFLWPNGYKNFDVKILMFVFNNCLNFAPDILPYNCVAEILFLNLMVWLNC